MKVLHVLDHSLPIQSGYSSRSRAIVRFQRRLGLHPIVLTSSKHPAARDDREYLDDIPHYRTHPPLGARSAPPVVRELLLMARLAGRIAAVARQERPEVIHAHSPSLNGLPALWAARRLGRPLVYEARAFWEDAAVDHGTHREGSLRYRVSRALETWLFRRAHGVVTICEGMRRDLAARGVAAERVTVVPNGVDVDWFTPLTRNESLAGRLGLTEAPVFGFVGSFYHYEGLRLLIEAFPTVREHLRSARLLLVGGGDEEGRLRESALPLGDAAVFAGRIPPDQVRDFYSLIDVFVCPRRRMRLTELVTPLKPLEAMAMERTVLASDVGGLTELVEHDVTGLLFRADDATDLIEQAARAGGDAALRGRLAARARSHVVAKHPWERVIARYLPLYQQVA